MNQWVKKPNLIFYGALLFFFFIASFFPLSTFSQSASGGIDLSISAIPLDPKPLETVTLEAKSYAANLDLASLSWTYGGKVISSGIGKTRVQVIAPKSGETALVTVTVTGFGEPASASALLRPASVDVLWQAVDSSTPPFYKGKALLSRSGAFKVVAVPAAAAPTGVTFSWTRNGDALQTASGYQKSSVGLLNTILNNTERIGVSVSGGLFSGGGEVTLTPGTPTAIAYQKREGFVNYANGSAGEVRIPGDEATLRFEPYFFSTPRGILTDLVYDMRFGADQVFGTPANELDLSRPEGSQSILSLGITTSAYSLQNLNRQFSLIFN